MINNLTTRRRGNGVTELDRFLDEFLGGFEWPLAGVAEHSLAKFTPKVNVSETKKAFKISAELPGIEENDVKVELNDDVLTISGEKKTETREEEEQWYRVEQSYGSFQRNIALASRVDAAKVKAKFKKGVLSVTLPKLKGEQGGKKTISVETA